MLKDTQAEREQMVKDMANRCKGIIEEAMKWAPDTMRSHLKEYINNKVQLHHQTVFPETFDSILFCSVLRIRDVYPGSRIPDPDFYPSRIPDLGPGSKNSNKREG
jgi:hypothetical protein